LLAALRPEPHRGDQVAAGVVALTVALVLVQVRFGEDWSPGAHLVYLLPAAAAVFAMGALSVVEDAKPRPYQSALYVCAFVLALLALGRLADALGAEGPFSASGTVFWIGALLTALAAWLAVERGSAVMTLVALVTAGVAWIALWDWVGDPSIATVRWLLLLLAVGYLLGAVGQRDRRPEHGVGFADAAGLAVFAIAATFLVETLIGTLFGAFAEGSLFGEVERPGVGAGWELLIVAAGFGLCAYGAIDRWRGPVYLGIANLGAFVLLAGAGEASLLWWPVLLLAGAGALLAVGLRPARPLPPPPDEHRPPAPAQPLPTQPPQDPPTTPLWRSE
jgi:hypothetical protein